MGVEGDEGLAIVARQGAKSGACGLNVLRKLEENPTEVAVVVLLAEAAE